MDAAVGLVVEQLEPMLSLDSVEEELKRGPVILFSYWPRLLSTTPRPHGLDNHGLAEGSIRQTSEKRSVG